MLSRGFNAVLFGKGVRRKHVMKCKEDYIAHCGKNGIQIVSTSQTYDFYFRRTVYLHYHATGTDEISYLQDIHFDELYHQAMRRV